MITMYKLSPSKAHRYLECTASLKHDLPFQETPASIRGSELHEAAERLFKEHGDATVLEQYNLNDYERFLINKYVNTIEEEKTKINANKVIVEEKTTINIYNNDINMIIDALIVGKNKAIIIDLKTGNYDVSPEDNAQLLFYGYGAITAYPHIKKLELAIFQKGKLRTTKISKGKVLDFFISKADVFEKISNNELEYTPSEKACKFCDYKNECMARAEWIVKSIN